MDILNYIIILLSSSVIFSIICKRMYLPSIIGYLIVGMLVGPGGLHWLPSLEDLHVLSEFGIVFLMFTLGLEFSIPRLKAAKQHILGMGSAQVIICSLITAIAGYFIGLSWSVSIIIGGGLALSSTAVVLKQLHEQKEQVSQHGSLAINILLFQDLAAIFILIVIPALSSSNEHQWYKELFITMVKGLMVCGGMSFLGAWVLRPLYKEIAKFHSNELFMMATLLVALSAAGLSYAMGLSLSLGAFWAGLILGETEFKHQIDLDIRPFRDVFLGLFFVVIGAYLEMSALPNIWLEVLVIFLLITVVKAGFVFVIVDFLSNHSTKVSFRVAIILAHGGEFGFLVLSEAIKHNLLLPEKRPAFFSALVMSIMVSPLIIRYNKVISDFVLKKNSQDTPEVTDPSYVLAESGLELDKHVIICGYGRVGQILTKFLEQEKISWLALDLDHLRITSSAMAGEKVFYGDANNPAILLSAGLVKARMVVLSFSDEDISLSVVKHIRKLRIDLPIFVRTKDDKYLQELQLHGATEVVPETLEGSIMLASHLLLSLGVPINHIFSRVRRIHYDRYSMLQEYYHGYDDMTNIDNRHCSEKSLHSLLIEPHAHMAGKELSTLGNQDSSWTLKLIVRNGKRYFNPDLNMILQAGDVLVILATPEEKDLVANQVLLG